MTQTFSLETCRLLDEICPGTDTHLQHVRDVTNGKEHWYCIGRTHGTDCEGPDEIPAFSFEETLRLLPAIMEALKKRGGWDGWRERNGEEPSAYIAKNLAVMFMEAQSEEAAYASCNKYFERILI